MHPGILFTRAASGFRWFRPHLSALRRAVQIAVLSDAHRWRQVLADKPASRLSGRRWDMGCKCLSQPAVPRIRSPSGNRCSPGRGLLAHVIPRMSDTTQFMPIAIASANATLSPSLREGKTNKRADNCEPGNPLPRGTPRDAVHVTPRAVWSRAVSRGPHFRRGRRSTGCGSRLPRRSRASSRPRSCPRSADLRHLGCYSCPS